MLSQAALTILAGALGHIICRVSLVCRAWPCLLSSPGLPDTAQERNPEKQESVITDKKESRPNAEALYLACSRTAEKSTRVCAQAKRGSQHPGETAKKGTLAERLRLQRRSQGGKRGKPDEGQKGGPNASALPLVCARAGRQERRGQSLCLQHRREGGTQMRGVWILQHTSNEHPQPAKKRKPLNPSPLRRRVAASSVPPSANERGALSFTILQRRRGEEGPPPGYGGTYPCVDTPSNVRASNF